MNVAGIIAEFDPLHAGHLRFLEAVRERLGAECALIIVLSGNFCQRGDFAVVRKHVRARAAVECGADLVLELPLPWAVSSAERFADGGVQVLLKTGVVTYLAFGSECGDLASLSAAAECMDGEPFREALQSRLPSGASFAACRQSAAEALLGPDAAAVLASPNNALGVEYLRALRRHNAPIQPLTVLREDGGHGGSASASAIREALRRGDRTEALAAMAPAMASLYQEEEAAGRAPVFYETCERAILAKLRSMDEADFAALDGGKEGMYRRLYAASRTASSLEEILQTAKTKRYAYARLRRMVLWAYLGLGAEDFPASIPYLRVLATNGRGRSLLARMRKASTVPVLTKPADVRALSQEARALFGLEVRASDLYALAFPDLSAAKGGLEWMLGPEIISR